MAQITLENVTKTFEDVTAVNQITLQVTDEEFLVLVGPSGCGKSTTLRLISGLEQPTTGQIRIDTVDVTDQDPAKRDVSMVFQDYALFPHMTARENMIFGMQSATNFGDETIKQRADDAAETLDISDLLDRKPSELSGGEQQRVAIGRALVRDPQVFLMDEPLANLDAKLRVQMRTELQELHRKLETTTIYVTHDQTEAMTLGDRVAVMNNGKIEQIDRPQRLYDHPETQFVAEFIGSPAMNMLPVSVTTTGEQNRVSHDQFEFALPDGISEQELTTTEAKLGIRPEDLTIVEDQLDNRLGTVTVTLVESRGDTLLVHGRIGETPLEIVSYRPQQELQTGDLINVAYNPQRLHLFDEQTGKAIYHSGNDRSNPEPTVNTQRSDPRSIQ